MATEAMVLDHDWLDEHDEPYGGWVRVSVEELRRIVADAGGLDALTVYSSLTDPDEVYTAWGRHDDGHPLVDMRDYKEDGRTTEVVCRQFVPRPVGVTNGKWRTDGARALCSRCRWGSRGDQQAVVRATRRHVEDTGHEVQIERTQWRWAYPSKETRS